MSGKEMEDIRVVKTLINSNFIQVLEKMVEEGNYSKKEVLENFNYVMKNSGAYA